MSFVNNSNDFFCENLFVFRENCILLENTQENATCKNLITQNMGLPSENILKKCIEQQAFLDFYSEPELNYSAMELESLAATPANCKFITLKEFYILADKKNIFLATRAKSLLAWKNKFIFCPKCASKLVDDSVLTAKKCTKCSTQFFPRITPAIIVIVNREDKILLVRHCNRIQNIWACISGFMEAGESAEECVAREVKEETGITVKNICYKWSQAWPFPDQLMLAFTAEYASGEITPQKGEILEGAWFDRNSLPEIPSPGTVAYNLITGKF